MFSPLLCVNISYRERCLKRVLCDSADTKKVQQINSRFKCIENVSKKQKNRIGIDSKQKRKETKLNGRQDTKISRIIDFYLILDNKMNKTEYKIK